MVYRTTALNAAVHLELFAWEVKVFLDGSGPQVFQLAEHAGEGLGRRHVEAAVPDGLVHLVA